MNQPAVSLLPTPTTATDSFLSQAAHDLVGRYAPEELSDLVVVVPTRRAVVYLKNELAMATSAGEALWSPRVAAMEDYMVELAGVQVEEPIALQLLLFDILKDIDADLDFDRFVGWSGLLLQDFSNLDQNLAPANKVFEYLSQAKALERWELSEAPSPQSITGAYFKFWDDLTKVYHRLRRRMLEQRVAYPGLAYRLATERVTDQVKSGAMPAKHVFLGLGYLSKAEFTLIDVLHRAGRAEVRFDADLFYLDFDSPNRAGQHLKNYLKRWAPPEFGDFGAPTDLLRTLPRHVRFVGVANASMQGKVAGQLLAEARLQFPNSTVAVVLPDETLLLPVLHGLPPDAVPDYNVTMGLSFQSTPLFNLVDLLFEVHLTGIREGTAETGYGVPRYHHLAVNKLLSHPFLRRYQQWLDRQPNKKYHGLLDGVCREIVKRNAVLLPAAELLEIGKSHPIIEALFKTWDTCDDIIAACYTLIDLLKQVYTEQHSAIEAEYLYLFYTLIKRLDSVFDCREQRLSVRSFRRFLYEQMTRTRLPFSGEPIADVQVMGLLETRALDFDHIILLSCNENVLPAPKRHTSLFPYDVLTEFRMPTYADHEAATSYQFWRLLQRTRRVDLVHVLPGAEGTRTGERSRFLLQLANDLLPQNLGMVLEDLTAVTSPPIPAATPKQGIAANRAPEFDFGSRVNPPSLENEPDNILTSGHEVMNDLVLQKDLGMLDALREVLIKGLSPTGLNEYLNCSLKFYFNRIARFREADEVEEALGVDGFGTIVHEVLEELLAPFQRSGKPLTAAAIPDLIKSAPTLVAKALRKEEEDRHARADEGLNHVLGQVATQLVRRYFESLLTQPNALPLQIQSIEEGLQATIYVALPSGEKLPVSLIGFADRVDQLPDGRLRVVDYKTGLVHAHELKLQKRNETPAEAAERLIREDTSAADKVRQLWLYRFMLEQGGRPAADAAIISLRNIPAGPMSADMSFLTADGQSFMARSEELLSQLVNRILDPAEAIRKTDDLEKCQYCPYQGICAR
ncbi:PD-(D/E)XK nuclease family protein [Hymenobacter sp. YC55]|uniref:PD-(D/E)XK nuclease family protein n=1 Tax=Hymenobacter sp. YC55 TaxID=3034019 RepID=UPI0023FA04F7|nr:PD-(D/E)XK nuclease family protein [Hymenobacter sp. YC55]MDF7811878.1 PD-(D/E)XK nuclease family protein [Hymenobacter sp. YC55]